GDSEQVRFAFWKTGKTLSTVMVLHNVPTVVIVTGIVTVFEPTSFVTVQLTVYVPNCVKTGTYAGLSSPATTVAGPLADQAKCQLSAVILTPVADVIVKLQGGPPLRQPPLITGLGPLSDFVKALLVSFP